MLFKPLKGKYQPGFNQESSNHESYNHTACYIQNNLNQQTAIICVLVQ